MKSALFYSEDGSSSRVSVYMYQTVWHHVLNHHNLHIHNQKISRLSFHPIWCFMKMVTTNCVLRDSILWLMMIVVVAELTDTPAPHWAGLLPQPGQPLVTGTPSDAAAHELFPPRTQFPHQTATDREHSLLAWHIWKTHNLYKFISLLWNY